MKPFDHAEASVKAFGGNYKDYIEIHKWFDQFRYSVPDARHRLFLHNTTGIMICEQVFGDYIENSAGNKIAVRDIAEHHIVMDVGCIRTPENWLDNLDNEEYIKPKPAKLDKAFKKARQNCSHPAKDEETGRCMGCGKPWILLYPEEYDPDPLPEIPSGPGIDCPNDNTVFD